MAGEELADLQASEANGQIDNAAVETTDNTPAETKPLSIREELEKSVAAAKIDQTGRAHGADGKFAPKQKSEAAPETAAPDKPILETKPEQQQAPSTAQAAPPPGWSKESKEAFKALPPSVQQDVLKRELEVSNGFKQKTEELKRYQDIEQIIAPARAEYSKHGMSDAQAINQLFAWEQSFRNPATRIAAFQNLARAYGVDFTQFAQPTGQVSEQEQIPAQLRPVVDQFGQVAQTVQTLEQRLNAQEQDRVQREIQAFAKDKPHFEKLRPLMGKLLQGGAATTMEDAYQQASKLDPDISALIAQEAQDKATAEAKKAAEDKARAARLAASSVRSAPTQGNVAQTKGKSTAKSVRETINEAVREARA
jgi:hypothetical protein